MAAQQTAGPPKDERTGTSTETSIARWVFWPSAVIILAFVLYATIFKSNAEDVITKVNEEIVEGLGWYYMAAVSFFVIFAIWVGLSHYGDIKLGKDEEKAEFSFVSWLAMLFAAGMGIGLVFFGVAEPLGHYVSPRPGTGGGEAEAADQAIVQTFMHWGLHPWAIYVVVGLAIAYAVHRKGRPVSLRWVLEPLLGDRVKGALGDVIDTIAIIGTLFGVATSLGFGVTQIGAGFEFLGWVDTSGDALKTGLIIGITTVAIISVVTGIEKGIKYLSNLNMGLAGALMLFVLIVGPTLFILNEFVTGIGDYVQNIVRLSFDTGATQGGDGADWMAGWTTFYWGWWISWAPFVGIFIARISRGRTVREFVLGVLLVPSLLTFAWFSVFGGSAINRQLFGSGGLLEDDGSVGTESSLFKLLDTFPGGKLVVGVFILLIVLFFVTSSDSGSYVVDMLASGGDPNPPVWSRVFWAAAEGAVAVALLTAGGEGSLTTLRTMAIIIALPFSMIMVAMCFATLKEFRRERALYLAAQRRVQTELLADHIVAKLENGDGDGDGDGGDSGEGKDDVLVKD